MGSGRDLADSGNKAELGQLGLDLGLNLSLADFPRGGEEVETSGCLAELGNNINGFDIIEITLTNYIIAT